MFRKLLSTGVSLSVPYLAKTVAEDHTVTKTPNPALKKLADSDQQALQKDGFTAASVKYYEGGNAFGAHKIFAENKPGLLQSATGARTETKYLSRWSLFNTVSLQYESKNNVPSLLRLSRAE